MIAAQTEAAETNPCRECGDEGHLWCRPVLGSPGKEFYTVDCENLACPNTTSDSHPTPAEAIAQWNEENPRK
jgi:hypothetical protein